MEASEVTELSAGILGVYSYQVLRASGADTLERYLVNHGYVLPKNTRDAFEHYLNQRWHYFFVARIVDPTRAGPNPSLGIKLSFATDSIVYPLYISRVSSTTGKVTLYILAKHRQVHTYAEDFFSGPVNRTTFRELPGLVDRKCHLTGLRFLFDVHWMQDITVHDGPDDRTFANASPSQPGGPSGVREPWVIAVDSGTGKAYVLDPQGNMSVIGPDHRDSPRVLNVALGIYAAGVAVNPRAGRVYVSNYNGGVLELDPTTGQPIGASIAAGRNPMPIAVNPVTDRIYVGNTGSGNLTIIEAGTRRTRQVPVGVYATGIAVDAARDRVFVTCKSSDFVTVLDGDGTDARNIVIGSRRSEPWSVAVDQVTGKAYIARHGDDRITVLRPDGSTCDLPGGHTPIAVAVDSKTHRAYVANYGSNDVTVVQDEAVLTTVPAGPGPIAVAANPTTGRIYVADFDGSSVCVINGQDNSREFVTCGDGPYALAVDQKAGRVFVANRRGGTVTVIEGALGSSRELDLSGGFAYQSRPRPERTKGRESGPARGKAIGHMPFVFMMCFVLLFGIGILILARGFGRRQ